MMRASGFILRQTLLPELQRSVLLRQARPPLQHAGIACARRFSGQMHLPTKRKANAQSGVAVMTILRDDLAAMRFNQLAGNGKSQSETAGTSARTAIELLEHFLFFPGSQA